MASSISPSSLSRTPLPLDVGWFLVVVGHATKLKHGIIQKEEHNGHKHFEVGFSNPLKPCAIHMCRLLHNPPTPGVWEVILGV